MPSLTPDDVGRRVVVRHLLEHGALATDILGVLVSWGGGELVVRRSDGALVTVPAAAVVAAKVVPPRAVARRDVRALEAAAAAAWPATERAALGGWLLRAASGFTGRANSCLPLGDPGMALPDAVAAVEAWYDARGLPPRFQVPEPLGAALTAHLDRLGWGVANPVLVLTAGAGALAGQLRPGLPDVRVDGAPDAAWLDAYHYRGGDLPATAAAVLTGGDVVGFATVVEDGRTVAVARGAVTDAPDGRRWLGVTAVEVVPAARRRGLGSHVVAGLCAWGTARGAVDVYLQVAEENAAGRAAYGQMGFVPHHRYHYRVRP